MKIEINNTVTENKFYNSIVEQEKKDFLTIIKKLQVNQGKKFSVYAIAAKIARGENVSSEELAYIKENAPALLEQAKEQYRDREKAEIDKNSESKEVKKPNSVNAVNNKSENIDKNSTKNDNDLAEVNCNNSNSIQIDKINTI